MNPANTGGYSAQKQGGNFNFYDPSGKPITALTYAQQTGQGSGGLKNFFNQLANQGDVNAQIASKYIDTNFTNVPAQYRPSLEALGIGSATYGENTGTFQPGAQQAATDTTVSSDTAKAAGLKGTITDLVGKAKTLYDQLFGGAQNVYSEKKSNLETQYSKGLGELAKSYATELPKIGQAYAAQGAYRSTWRGGAEQAAQQGYQKQLSDLAEAQKQAIAGLGGEFTKTQAQVSGGKSELQTVLDRIAGETDINALTSLRNKLDTQIADLQTNIATTQTQPQQLAAAGGIASVSDKFNQANQTISTIINGQAPAALKKQIASQIVTSSDLTDQEKQQLQNRINSEIA